VIAGSAKCYSRASPPSDRSPCIYLLRAAIHGPSTTPDSVPGAASGRAVVTALQSGAAAGDEQGRPAALRSGGKGSRGDAAVACRAGTMGARPPCTPAQGALVAQKHRGGPETPAHGGLFIGARTAPGPPRRQRTPAARRGGKGRCCSPRRQGRRLRAEAARFDGVAEGPPRPPSGRHGSPRADGPAGPPQV